VDTRLLAVLSESAILTIRGAVDPARCGRSPSTPSEINRRCRSARAEAMIDGLTGLLCHGTASNSWVAANSRNRSRVIKASEVGYAVSSTSSWWGDL
jgi:hypothetical protein